MKSGSVEHWHKAEGDMIEEEDLLFDVSSDNVIEDGYQAAGSKSAMTMQVECHDDAVLARLLEPSGSGKRLQVGHPLAVLCESESDIQTVRDLIDQGEDVDKLSTRDAVWQAYVKAEEGQLTGDLSPT
eukprot:TRINITY_DN35832_c0_g1_i1.p1 TRINITY_DN35832_c0_g1~~TRINITY_DN35832_c0_g1_i1.p1  ORF type:complete len:149 (+),score=20.48 TRINITY_DN35832_c0_g1_i1:66-449(+)